MWVVQYSTFDHREFFFGPFDTMKEALAFTGRHLPLEDEPKDVQRNTAKFHQLASTFGLSPTSTGQGIIDFWSKFRDKHRIVQTPESAKR